MAHGAVHHPAVSVCLMDVAWLALYVVFMGGLAVGLLVASLVINHA